VSDLNVGTKQKMGNVSTFCPFPNSYENKLSSAMNRVTVQKIDDYDVLDSITAHVGDKEDLNDESSFNDESTIGISSVHSETDLNFPKRKVDVVKALRVSRLGLVFHDPKFVEGDYSDKQGSMSAVIERTEIFSGVSNFFSRETKPIIVRERPVPLIRKLVRRRTTNLVSTVAEEDTEGDHYVIDLESSTGVLDSVEPLAGESTDELLSSLDSMSPEEQEAYRVRIF
jgi:hypothetical protein